MIGVARAGRRLASLAMALMVGGCAGDFGRPRQLFGETYTPAVLISQSQVDPSLALGAATDEERRMRTVAYSLIVAPDSDNGIRPYLPVEIDFAATLEGERRPLDRTAYGRRLVSMPARSEEMRYQRLLEDMRNDMTLMNEFAAVARHVADMDRKRELSLGYVSGLTERERADTQERVRQNGRIIRRVLVTLDERAAAYRYALERLAISTPSPSAAQAERTLNEFKRRIAEVYPPRRTA